MHSQYWEIHPNICVVEYTSVDSVLLIFAGIVSDFSLYLLVAASRRTGAMNYEEVRNPNSDLDPNPNINLKLKPSPNPSPRGM